MMSHENSSIFIDSLVIDHPLMNAAGTCKLLDDVLRLARSATAAVVVGSITMKQRDGNQGDVYWASSMYSLNSLGLPNPGAQYYKVHLPAMVQAAHDNGKPLFVSVAGFSPIEYSQLAEIVFESGADMIELNLGCPNVWVEKEQKPIASFVPELVEEILDKVEGVAGSDQRTQRVSIKVSPFSNPVNLLQIAHIVARHPIVKVITTSNTFPNAFALSETGDSLISGSGLAGFAGPAMKPIALGQVRQWHEALPDGVLIFGVGGVSSGRDIWEYQKSGATAVQVGTAYLERGEHVFSQILSEYVDLEPD